MSELSDFWSLEYKRKGIPSSFRKDPSKTVVDFLKGLEKRRVKIGGSAADIGCGQGRNSYFLASKDYQVVALDFLEENVQLVKEQAKAKNLSIEAFRQSAATPWPTASNSLDIAIDVFCYKHIVQKKEQAFYRKELGKSLKKEGFYFISLASEKDGFYGPLLEHSTDIQNKLIIDPYSNIPSFLYSIDDLLHEFSDLFEVVEIQEQSSTSPMYGKEYSRKVINAIFKKRD